MKYFLASTLLLLIGLTLLIPPVFQLKWGSLEIVIWDKEKGKTVRNLYQGSPHWYPLDRTSHMTLAAIIVAEDVFFYDHPGIDLGSIIKSLKANYRAGQIKGGASTITQQVVRLAFLSHQRSYLRKVREALGALCLEFFLTKEEILAWYLNILYFGPGLIGIKDASHFYFATEPVNLNLNHSIQLALVLPRPNFFGKQLIKKSLSKGAKKRFSFILGELRNNRLISFPQWKNAQATGNFGNPIRVDKK